MRIERAPEGPRRTNRRIRTHWALATLLLAAACGAGTDGKPVAPPTTPAPAPEPTPAPPPPPPTVRAVAELWSQPSTQDGYYVGTRIRVVLNFSPETTTVEGSPRLAIQIGEHVRLAEFSPWVEDDFPPERPSFLQRFEYEVRADDADSDGVTIHADALDFSDGAVLDGRGVEIEVGIHTVDPRGDRTPVDPGEALDTHRVLGAPEPRDCTDERERAATFSLGAIAVDEWDGTPFRFDIVRGFPDSLTEADLARLLEAVTLVDRKIEAQLGYRIPEVGEVIPWPAGPGPPGCALPRERGQLQGYYSTAREHGAAARPQCAEFFYTPGLVAEWCPPCGDQQVEGTKYMDAITLHEILHLLGFNHDFGVDPTTRHHGGVEMSVALTTVAGPDTEAVLWSDIDALRCIFPEGG